MENIKLIKETAEELFKQIGLTGEIDVTEKEETYNVKTETEESGILIGFHGETLSGFQLILGLIIYKKLGSWLKVIVDVGDYRERREENLKQTAEAAAEKVLASGSPVELYELSSFERRIVHLLLVDHPKVTSESEGEGKFRKLVIRLKDDQAVGQSS